MLTGGGRPLWHHFFPSTVTRCAVLFHRFLQLHARHFVFLAETRGLVGTKWCFHLFKKKRSVFKLLMCCVKTVQLIESHKQGENNDNWVQNCTIVNDPPSPFTLAPRRAACVALHSSVTAPSVCRKNGEALCGPLGGFKYAGLL